MALKEAKQPWFVETFIRFIDIHKMGTRQKSKNSLQIGDSRKIAFKREEGERL